MKLRILYATALVTVACGGGPDPSSGSETDGTGAATTAGMTTTTGTPDPTTDATTTTGETTMTPTTAAPDPTTTGGATTTDPGETTDATTGGATPPASLDDVVDGELELIADGHMFTEGPLWHPDGFLLYSDIPADTIFRWKEGEGVSEYRKPSGNSNGLAFDTMGRLLLCEHGGRRVSRVVGDVAETVAGAYMGDSLNSPNDVTVRSDGTLYFTDPPYGIEQNQQELPFQGVFRVDPQGALSLVAEDFDRPNGIALAPDESRLYVADTAAEHVRVFDVMPDGSAAGGEVFIDLASDLPGDPDGMAVDVFGDLYVTGGGGVRVVTPDGTLLGTIDVPGSATNCKFGDPDGQALFITAPPNVYRLRLKVAGHGLP